MVKTKREYILASAFLSGIAVGLSLVSLGTTQWVIAEATFVNETNNTSDIEYGLFSGYYLQRLGGEGRFTLKPTCLISENVCAYLCSPTSEQRQKDLETLFRNEIPLFSCDFIRSRAVPTNETGDTNDKFINAGLYISTIVFLALSVIFGFLATVLAVWNTAGNPIEVIFSVYGIYIYDLIACVSSMIALILWGALFGSHITNNVSVHNTIIGVMSTSGSANLGFSYWLILPSTVLYAFGIFVLILRQHFINQEPVMNIHTQPLDDGGQNYIIF